MAYGEPLVSIGMPVYNGADYIQQALDSLLAQSYANLEINISDNASTDGTEEICRLYLAKDDRIHYHRNPRNIGLMGNWRRVLELASGEYFMWAACDDVWSTNYVATLLECLLMHPQAVLSAPRTLFINPDGSPSHLEPDDAPGRYANMHVGTAKQLFQQHAMGWLYGIYRKEELGRWVHTFFEADPFGADILFLLQVCLNTEIVGSDAAIMYKRVTYITGPKTPRQRVKWQCWFARALFEVIRHSALSAEEKRELFKAYVNYLRWFYFRRGVISWAKLWGKAGLHWLIGVDWP
jgi:glycosyltransferase involved in cell wall biosynthesis